MPKRRKSKQGELWAVKTLAKAQVHHGRPCAEAMRDAEDILRWRLGANAPGWRVYRLAQALAAK
jgi:hypothetical protein